MTPICSNCNEPLSPDGLPFQHKHGGYCTPWRCYRCHISVIAFPLPEEMINPFESSAPGAQTQSYEDYEKSLPDYLPYPY